MNRLSLQYIAGLFDGEGCVYIHKIRRGEQMPTFWLEIILSNSDKKVLERCKDAFKKGSVTSGTRGKIKRKHPWHWRVSSLQAKTVLESLLPFLWIKKKQAKIGIEFQKRLYRKGSRPLTKDEVRIREILRKKIHRLNS